MIEVAAIILLFPGKNTILEEKIDGIMDVSSGS